MTFRQLEPVLVFATATVGAGIFTFAVWRQPGGPSTTAVMVWMGFCAICLVIMIGSVIIYERRRREAGGRDQ